MLLLLPFPFYRHKISSFSKNLQTVTKATFQLVSGALAPSHGLWLAQRDRLLAGQLTTTTRLLTLALSGRCLQSYNSDHRICARRRMHGGKHVGFCNPDCYTKSLLNPRKRHSLNSAPGGFVLGCLRQ